jgi:hypothetical protein
MSSASLGILSKFQKQIKIKKYFLLAEAINMAK